MSNIIYAYTKLDQSYPGYINVKREDDGSVVLTMRGDPWAINEGQTATVTLAEHEWHAIVFAIQLEMNMREKKYGRAVPPHGSGP